MKKRLLAVLAATAVVGATTAFAVNPFSDVTPNDWAYQAVSQLAAQGVVNGYPDGTFKGQRNITRYEMAQIIAKALARQNRLDAEQNAMLQRLANEFSAELNNLGVRVGNLEKKVGNVRFTGSVNVKYAHTDGVKKEKQAPVVGDGMKDTMEDSKWTAGAELDLFANPNKNVEFGAVVKAKDFTFGENNSAGKGLYFDKLWVGTNVKGFALKAGRLGAFLGSGLVLDSKIDGVSAAFDAANLGFAVGHGDVVFGEPGVLVESTYAQVTGKVADKLNVTGYYLQLHKKGVAQLSTEEQVSPEAAEIVTAFDNVYGVSVETNVQNVKLMGEWATSNAKVTTTKKAGQKTSTSVDAKDRDAWVVGAGFGNYDIAKAGTADLMVQYFNEGVNSPILASTYDQEYMKDFKGWVLTGNYALADNLGLTLVYGFAGERAATLAKGEMHKDYPAHYYAKLKYQF